MARSIIILGCSVVCSIAGFVVKKRNKQEVFGTMAFTFLLVDMVWCLIA